ncbi:MAG: TonB-dependent receptor [Saprospiraceae bacterium]|nr:TonB-dependent receptor [Bacteroidia bacterium]NNE13403.1 TonB-dependent receptor [Saprospiraceae bacterium]
MKKQKRHFLKAAQKALDINLNKKIYGSFAEIGAGQEVARNFFQAGAAAGTIAKTMSAYDKTYSDAIYGVEDSGRYVCESRLYKMLDHEYGLMDERLTSKRPESLFFAFADTVAAINYKRTIKGSGWMGIRFQLKPDGPTNDLIIHVKMNDGNSHLQQEAIGVLGVNMVYACFKLNDDMHEFIQSLVDGIHGRVSIDMIRLEGPDFNDVDNRLLSLYIVKYGLTDVAIFNSNKRSIHASEFLWKKDLMVVRGHYHPPTKVTMDAFSSSLKQFKREKDVDEERAYLVAEITMENLIVDGVLNFDDFLERADCLCELGFDVIVSDCQNHQTLINYLSDYNIGQLGLVIGVRELSSIIEEKFFNNQDGRLLVAFGELFNRNIKVYVYPAYFEKGGPLINAKTLMVPDGIHFLYKHLIDAKQVVEIEGYDKSQLDIMPWEVLESIEKGDKAWEDAVPEKIKNLIIKKGLFNYAQKSLDLA